MLDGREPDGYTQCRWFGGYRQSSRRRRYYPARGLPIGNLTSQLFANIYLNDFDHFIKRNLKIRYYGRYVDDMVFVHRDKEYLKSIIPIIRNYLKENLDLKLREKKIYLQHYSKGVKFLGVFLKPYRIYIDKRAKGNFYCKTRECNLLLKRQDYKISRLQAESMIACFNSYLGLLSHYQTDRLKKNILHRISIYFWNYCYIQGGFLKRGFHLEKEVFGIAVLIWEKDYSIE